MPKVIAKDIHENIAPKYITKEQQVGSSITVWPPLFYSEVIAYAAKLLRPHAGPFVILWVIQLHILLGMGVTV